MNIIFLKMKFIQCHTQESKDWTSNASNKSGKIYCSRVQTYGICKATVEKWSHCIVRNYFYIYFSCLSYRKKFSQEGSNVMSLNKWLYDVQEQLDNVQFALHLKEDCNSKECISKLNSPNRVQNGCLMFLCIPWKHMAEWRLCTTFLAFALDGSEWSSSHTGCLPPWKGPQTMSPWSSSP